MKDSYAIVTIELPLRGGDIEDARVLADIIEARTLSSNGEETGVCVGLQGRITGVYIEQRDRLRAVK